MQQALELGFSASEVQQAWSGVYAACISKCDSWILTYLESYESAISNVVRCITVAEDIMKALYSVEQHQYYKMYTDL